MWMIWIQISIIVYMMLYCIYINCMSNIYFDVVKFLEIQLRNLFGLCSQLFTWKIKMFYQIDAKITPQSINCYKTRM